MLQFIDVRTKRLTSAALPENAPLGHQDPAWRPDGSAVLYVVNARNGSAGAPAIWRYVVATKTTVPFTSAGYTAPAWSPDGRYVAAVRTTSLGTDVVILDAKGAELARVTTDGRSSGPTWSPDGTQLAFLRLSGVTVDLQLATLERAANGTVSVAKTDALTTFSGLDGNSRPAWWAPAPPPAASPSAVPSPNPVAIVTSSYLEMLADRSAAVGSVLCVGIDPTPDSVPDGFPRTLAGVERFALLIVEAAAPVAAAMKPNLAFFEAFGSPGLAALERVRAAIPAGVPVIADAKRGDVETTVARQAVALFDHLGVDAVTASPYLGLGALGPFLERSGRFTYVLCRTSNRAAGELQDLVVAAEPDRGFPAEPLHRRVARLVAAAGLGNRAGLVVGATAPAELAGLREIVPGLAFLVPGVGAQGGEAADVLASGVATAGPAGGRPGGGLLVNVSRGIAGAALGKPPAGGPDDPGERLAEARPARGPRACLCYAEPAASRARMHGRSGPDLVVRGSPRCRTSAPSSWSSSS